MLINVNLIAVYKFIWLGLKILRVVIVWSSILKNNLQLSHCISLLQTCKLIFLRKNTIYLKLHTLLVKKLQTMIIKNKKLFLCLQQWFLMNTSRFERKNTLYFRYASVFCIQSAGCNTVSTFFLFDAVGCSWALHLIKSGISLASINVFVSNVQRFIKRIRVQSFYLYKYSDRDS